MNIRNWSIQLCVAWTGRRRICALKYNQLLFDLKVAQNFIFFKGASYELFNVKQNRVQ